MVLSHGLKSCGAPPPTAVERWFLSSNPDGLFTSSLKPAVFAVQDVYFFKVKVVATGSAMDVDSRFSRTVGGAAVLL